MTNQIGKHTSAIAHNSSKYEYIFTQDELIKAFNDSRNALNYQLLKESKRQRFLIANSKGLEELFYKMVNEDITKATQTIEKNVANDLYGYLMATMNNSTFSPSNSSFDLGAILGRALGNTISALARSIWDHEDRQRYR